jgi:hypothetical protein
MKKLENLPDFDTNILSEFTFGDPEAKSDEILVDCFQDIEGVRTFLGGTKNIVLGERGSGKSALFKLIANKKLQFRIKGNEKHRKLLIVPIDDDLEYLTIANTVENRFSDQTKRPYGKHRYLWEIYILGRIIDQLNTAYKDEDEITKLNGEFGEIMGITNVKPFRLKDLFTSYKITLGGKFESDPATTALSVTPTVSLEKNNKDEIKYVTDREINKLKERLIAELNKKNLTAIVLVDRIDDFVVGFEYEEQIKHIQALVDCLNDFRIPEIKLKIFLRTDLFKRLNFEHGGFDKISHQITSLEWTKEDICEFVARRLIFNFNKYKIKVPINNINIKLLEIDPNIAQQLNNVIRVDAGSLMAVARLYYVYLRLRINLLRAKYSKHHYRARHTDLIQSVIIKFVTFIFPSKVDHYNNSCIRERISIEDFLSTHFKLGGNNPNPRLVLLFLINTLNRAIHYYARNPDKKNIPVNPLNEYELILRDHIDYGYRKLQENTRRTVAELNADYKNYIERLFSKIDKPLNCCALTPSHIRTLIDSNLTDDEFHMFIAFFSHIGLFVPDNPTSVFGKRTYSFPIVMRICKDH